MLDLVGNFFQMSVHLLDLDFHVFLVFPEHPAAFFQGGIPLHAQFDEIFDLFDGHSRIFKTTDKAYPFQIVFGIPADAVPAAGNTGQEALIFIVTQYMGRQGRFFRNLFNGKRQKILQIDSQGRTGPLTLPLTITFTILFYHGLDKSSNTDFNKKIKKGSSGREGAGPGPKKQ
jgi:hypothetical protein